MPKTIISSWAFFNFHISIRSPTHTCGAAPANATRLAPTSHACAICAAKYRSSSISTDGTNAFSASTQRARNERSNSARDGCLTHSRSNTRARSSASSAADRVSRHHSFLRYGRTAASVGVSTGKGSSDC
jgi:hypothetical protein